MPANAPALEPVRRRKQPARPRRCTGEWGAQNPQKHGTFFNQAPKAKPLGKPGKVIALTPTRPICWLSASWSAAEQAVILAGLQALTDDHLTLNGFEVYSDFSATGPHAVGIKLVRGLQNPTTKVVIIPPRGASIPETGRDGGDIVVEAALTNGQLAIFAFYTVQTLSVPTPGIPSNAWPTQTQNNIEKAPGYIPIAHELVHAYRMLRSEFVSGNKTYDFVDPDGYTLHHTASLEELTVVGVEGSYEVSENLIRKEQGLSRNVAYVSASVSLVLQGVTAVAAPAGKPLPPTWWPTPNVP
jgi:hypothetical protein